nr:site-specific DNA-methyltransferase [Fretibacterium fastidiosum]
MLYREDCFDIFPDIPDGSVDMILCDLPYGTTNFTWDKKLPFGRLWTEYSRLIREHGAIALTAQQPFATDLIVAGRKLFRYELIWEKTLACGFLNANRMPLRAHENILIFYKKLPIYHPQMALGTSYYKKGGGDGSVYGRKYRIQEHRNTGQRYPHLHEQGRPRPGQLSGKRHHGSRRRKALTALVGYGERTRVL